MRSEQKVIENSINAPPAGIFTVKPMQKFEQLKSKRGCKRQ
tara:strand:- start:158 stop:280 length:123 start_codon:yes stop_codon:yes gene_type:complete